MSGMPSSLNENTIVEGVIWKRMLIFFLPILFGNFFQQFYSVADAAIVGRALGSDALAAIDSTWSLFRIPTTFFIGVSAGATIQLSQAFGAKDGPRCSRLIHTAAAAALLFGLLLSAAVAIACPWPVSYTHLVRGHLNTGLALTWPPPPSESPTREKAHCPLITQPPTGLRPTGRCSILPSAYPLFI